MARILKTPTLLLALSLFTALQSGASPLPAPGPEALASPDHHHHHHHHNHTEAKRDGLDMVGELDLMKRNPLAGLQDHLNELVARQSSAPPNGLAAVGPILTGVGQIISGTGSLISGVAAASAAQRSN